MPNGSPARPSPPMGVGLPAEGSASGRLMETSGFSSAPLSPCPSAPLAWVLRGAVAVAVVPGRSGCAALSLSLSLFFLPLRAVRSRVSGRPCGRPRPRCSGLASLPCFLLAPLRRVRRCGVAARCGRAWAGVGCAALLAPFGRLGPSLPRDITTGERGAWRPERIKTPARGRGAGRAGRDEEDAGTHRKRGGQGRGRGA